jgi:hypothetical protein
LRIRLFFAYSRGVPNRQCRVSFTDSEGITHCAEVAAESLYEAAVLALAEFGRCGFTDAQTGPATRLTIAVLAPSTSHKISVGKVRAWLDSSGRSPAQQALKVRLREVLGRA